MAIDIMLPNGTQMQQLVDVNDSVLDMSTAPVITLQTITSTKAKIPATAKSGRKVMNVTNLDDVRVIRIGSTAITGKIGFIVEPRQTVKVMLNPNNAQDVWAIAIGAEVKVEVVEL